MRQAFILADAALDAIGTPPPTGSPTGRRWGFPEQETRDMSARIFGTNFDVGFESEIDESRTTINKFNIVKGTYHWVQACSYRLLKIVRYLRVAY